MMTARMARKVGVMSCPIVAGRSTSVCRLRRSCSSWRGPPSGRRPPAPPFGHTPRSHCRGACRRWPARRPNERRPARPRCPRSGQVTASQGGVQDIGRQRRCRGIRRCLHGGVGVVQRHLERCEPSPGRLERRSLCRGRPGASADEDHAPQQQLKPHPESPPRMECRRTRPVGCRAGQAGLRRLDGSRASPARDG